MSRIVWLWLDYETRNFLASGEWASRLGALRLGARGAGALGAGEEHVELVELGAEGVWRRPPGGRRAEREAPQHPGQPAEPSHRARVLCAAKLPNRCAV